MSFNPTIPTHIHTHLIGFIGMCIYKYQFVCKADAEQFIDSLTDKSNDSL